MNQYTPAQPAKKSGGGKMMLIGLVGCCLISVPVVGVLAAIGIPAFTGYLTRSKTSEARSNLSSMFQSAAAYYSSESWGSTSAVGAGVAQTACTVSSGITPNTPSASKTMLGPLGEPFDSLGFALVDPVYYQYEIVSVGGCGHQPGETLYTFRAYGDLDGDGVTSMFEIAAGANEHGELFRSPGVYTENELE